MNGARDQDSPAAKTNRTPAARRRDAGKSAGASTKSATGRTAAKTPSATARRATGAASATAGRAAAGGQSKAAHASASTAAKAKDNPASASARVGEAVEEGLRSTREAVAQTQEKLSAAAKRQRERTSKTVEDVATQSMASVETAAARAMSTVQDAAATIEKSAEGLAETLREFASQSATVTGKVPEERQMRVGHVAYLLYALWPLTFVSGLFGVMLCYLRRGDAAVDGTVLNSHFRWLTRTFWIGIAAALVAALAAWTLSDVLAGIVLVLALVWFAYRVVKGWLALYDGKSMARPDTLF